MSEREIEHYLDRVARYLAPLPDDEVTEILAELRSHLVESAALGDDALQRTFKGLGSAEDFARGYLDDEVLRSALAGGSPADLWMGVLRQAPRRVGAFVGFGIVSIFYLFAFSFFAIILLKIISPDQTGLWVGPGMEPFFLGMIGGDGPDAGLRDIAGVWLIPLALTLGTFTTVCGLSLSRLIAKSLLK